MTPTNWTGRTIQTTSWSDRPGITFIATEALDFLMTESDDYLVTNDSIVTNWSGRNIP